MSTPRVCVHTLHRYVPACDKLYQAFLSIAGWEGLGMRLIDAQCAICERTGIIVSHVSPQVVTLTHTDTHLRVG